MFLGLKKNTKKHFSHLGLLRSAVTPTAAEPPVAEARLRTSREWLDADCERAVDERCAVADSSARARAAVSARWSHRYAPSQCNAPKMEDSNVEGKRE